MYDTRIAAASTARLRRRSSRSSAYSTYNLDTVSRRGGPEGEVSSISRTPLRLTAVFLRGRPIPPARSSRSRRAKGERGAPEGCAVRGGNLLRPSVSSRLVSRDGLVSRQPSSVRIDTPATLTTPTSSTFYCEKQCTYRPRARVPPVSPCSASLSPPPRKPSLASLAASSSRTGCCQRTLSLVESS